MDRRYNNMEIKKCMTNEQIKKILNFTFTLVDDYTFYINGEYESYIRCSDDMCYYFNKETKSVSNLIGTLDDLVNLIRYKLERA